MTRRFTEVRRLRADGWGPPELLDAGTKTVPPRLMPRDGIPIAGGSLNALQTPRWTLGDFPSSLSLTSTTLSSAYAFNSAGAAVAHRYAWPAAKTLTAVYYFTATVAGTPTLVNLEAYRNNTGTTPVTGATSLGTTTHTPNLTPNRWSKVTWALGAIGGHATDRYVWIVLGDADGTAGARIAVSRINALVGGRGQYFTAQSFSTTAGWTGTPTNDTAQSMLVLIFDDGTAAGTPFSASTNTVATNTQQGLRLGGLTAAMTLRGWRVFISTGAVTSAFVWEGTAGPAAGTNLVSGIGKQFASATNSTEMTLFATPVTLAAATPYRLTVASASIGIMRHQVGTLVSGTASELMAAVIGGGEFYYTFEAAGAWSNLTSDYPVFELIFEDQVASAGGGGSGGGLRAAGRGGLAVGA